MNYYIEETQTIEWQEEIINRECIDIILSLDVYIFYFVKLFHILTLEHNWLLGISKKGHRTISCREYYCFKFQIRQTPQIILLVGKLFQQYAVDMYIKFETTRLDFLRAQQSRIRSELNQGLVDVVNVGETKSDKPGTFVGGPRDMRWIYLDAMTLKQRFKTWYFY